MQIKQFIKALSSPLYDGRVLLSSEPQTEGARSILKYFLLNPNVCFEDIVSEAKAIVMAGGTMKPLSDFEQMINDKTRIEHFSCGHVISQDNLIALGMSTGPNGIKLEFSYNNRDNTQMLDELGAQLLQLCTIVPNGIIVFFVSYDYLDKVVNHFKKKSILTQLDQKKKVFYEPRLATECEKAFNDYTKCIKKTSDGSAMLFAVVGGKMSEGINFSDELGRCVVIVGQPYANIKSLELNEKMDYLNKNYPKVSPNNKTAGQQYYEGLCWKAINQSVGRAIRHQNDFASIILMDSRYCTRPLNDLKDKLPDW
jgi:chromosome transmission fidelity protein 1